jgi:uncharacterized protein YhjY with autotransporter beta-barrel domain
MFSKSFSLNLGRVLFSLLLPGLSAQVLAATAVDDFYFADQMQQIVDIECGVGYVLSPGPEGNDTFTGDLTSNIDYGVMRNSFFQSGNGPGIITNRANGVNPNEFLYFPDCGGGNDGSFSVQATFSYDLFDTADQTRDSALITINPPGQLPPTAVDDTYNLTSLNLFFGGQSQNVGYLLSTSPLANDNVTQSVDLSATLRQSNFIPAGNPNGSLFVDIISPGVANIYFVPGPLFNSPASFTYHLLDSEGIPLSANPGTITITPLSPPTAAVADVYDAVDLQVVTDQSGNSGYRLIPDNPFGNDNLGLASTNDTAFAADNFQLVSGTGALLILPNEGPEVFEYYPGANFTAPAQFSYNLRDYNGNIQSGSVTVTINPPTPPFQLDAVDDPFDVVDLTQVPDPFSSSCGTGYAFDPLANDIVSSPNYSAIANSFSAQSGTQGFITSVVSNGPPQFIFFPSCPSTGFFSTPQTFQYTLFDLDDPNNSDIATITFNPPPQPTISNDVYDADDASEVQVIPGSVVGQFEYVLQVSPFANDTFIPPADQAGTRDAEGNFFPAAGTVGSLEFTRTLPTQFTYVPGALFTQTATFNYFLADAQGNPIAGASGTITINPPAPASTTDDNVSGTDLTETAGPGTGETTYTLNTNPLDNDNLAPPYDQNETFAATDNFTLTGNGVFQAFIGDNGPVFRYITSEQFNAPVTVAYNLRDAQGAVIPNTNAVITINPPISVDAVDDTVITDSVEKVIDPDTGNIGYLFDPFVNDTYPGQSTSNLNLTQTLDPANFVRSQGIGSIVATSANNQITFVYYPGAAFTDPAVFSYTLFASDDSSDTAQITLNPPGNLPPAPVLTRESDIEDACNFEEVVNQRVPAICNDELISASERMLMLSTITAQSDAFFGMQSDLIGNIRQRMSENRSVYNPASVAGLNSNLFGKQVPIGRIVQELLKPLTGGAAADDFNDSGRLGFFLNGTFSAGDRDETGLTSGYDQEGYNFTSGIDYRVNLNFVVGAALGIANEDTEFSSNRGEQGADLTSFSVYGNYFPSNALYADFLVMMTQGDLDIDRNVNFGLFNEVASGKTESDLLSFAGTLGYHWNSGAWEMDGYSRVEYTELEIDGYTESGSSFDLTVLDQEAESLEGALGFKVARVVSLRSGVIIPSLDLEWLSQFEDDSRFIGVNMEQISSGFAVQDEGADSSYYNAAFSLSSIFANGFSAYVRVESQFGDDQISRARYSGGLRWEF